jgi:hypothetical protein
MLGVKPRLAGCDKLTWIEVDINREMLGESEMKHHSLKNVNNCLNTNIYFYLETSGGQSYILYLNVVHFFNTNAN